MDISRYIAEFFTKHGLTRDEINHFAANLLGSPVSATLVHVWAVHVYVAAFCRVKKQCLQQTVQDFCKLTKNSYRFFTLAWINKPAYTLEPPPGLLGEYSKILDKVSLDLPTQLQAKLDDVRQELPRLFRSNYLMATGHITGIVDWADAKIAPFGVSLAAMEVVLGIQTRTNWHFHPNHHSLRESFWKTFYRVAGHISKDDRRSIEVARLFGFFREYGREEKEHAIVYLSALCLL
ncbi:hypothetical protein BKA61DRAFT_632312 [Leptodontidium sp. MPI-SDFR-AT-0119]|nr:hypothetical protein BKA61DRAFT_632312 [Leptodontidium sp. MPI-SDFR-AT-0119]